MKPEQMTQGLEAIASQLGVRVRYETMTGESMGAGGLCKIRGDWAIIIDKRATPSDRAAILVDALSGFDTSALALPKEVGLALAGRRARGTGVDGVAAAAPDEGSGNVSKAASAETQPSVNDTDAVPAA